MPVVVNTLKESTVVCAAIRYFRVKSEEEIKNNVIKVQKIQQKLEEKIEAHCEKENEKFNQQYTSLGAENNKNMNLRIEAKNEKILFLLAAHKKKFPESMEIPEPELMDETLYQKNKFEQIENV